MSRYYARYIIGLIFLVLSKVEEDPLWSGVFGIASIVWMLVAVYSSIKEQS